MSDRAAGAEVDGGESGDGVAAGAAVRASACGAASATRPWVGSAALRTPGVAGDSDDAGRADAACEAADARDADDAVEADEADEADEAVDEADVAGRMGVHDSVGGVAAGARACRTAVRGGATATRPGVGSITAGGFAT